MKRFFLPAVVVAAFCYVMGGAMVEAAKPAPRTASAAKGAKTSCVACHSDFTSVLPKGHPAAKGNDLAACSSCHRPDTSGKAVKNAFSAKMHMAHLPPKGALDCKACHTWTPGKSFGLIGAKASLGSLKGEEMKLMQQTFASWTSSGTMDALHGKAGVVCAGCHGKDLPKSDDTVENARCLECHGPMDQLVKRSEPKDFADRNPHKSHLGEIACTVCHRAHAESKVYCLDCHKNFKMTVPGAAKAKP